MGKMLPVATPILPRVCLDSRIVLADAFREGQHNHMHAPYPAVPAPKRPTVVFAFLCDHVQHLCHTLFWCNDPLYIPIQIDVCHVPVAVLCCIASLNFQQIPLTSEPLPDAWPVRRHLCICHLFFSTLLPCVEASG